jgi:REP element-mobilizing transposase RayT
MDHKFFHQNEPLKVHHKHLPHWRQDGVTYFVTARLADSMPKSRVDQWQMERSLWLSDHAVKSANDLSSLPPEAQQEFHRTFTMQWEQWLDAGEGSCLLKEPTVRAVVAEELVRPHAALAQVDAWVVMPNHFHALVSPKLGQKLGDVVKSWKGVSARRINLQLGLQGSLWQAEFYDHIVRSEPQLHHYRRYVANNPIKAKLHDEHYTVGLREKILPSARTLLEIVEAEAHGGS